MMQTMLTVVTQIADHHAGARFPASEQSQASGAGPARLK
jgi:hypothetical protein